MNTDTITNNTSDTVVENNPSNTLESVQVTNENGPNIPTQVSAPNNQGVVPVKNTESTGASVESDKLTATPELDDLKRLLGNDDTTDTAKSTEQAQSLETGNAVIDAGVAMLQKVAGLENADVDRALGKAIEFGNPALIDSVFLKERFGEHAEYAETLCKAFFKESQNQTQSIVNSVYEAAGGSEQWLAVRDSFKAKAPIHQQEAAKALIDSGKIKDGVQLILDYCRSEGLVVVPGEHIKGQVGLAGAALSASEFSTEYAKLRKEAGNRSLESNQFAARYQSLLQRRAAGKAIGR